MSDKVLQEDSVPAGRVQSGDVEQSIILDLLDLGEEAFLILWRKTRIRNGPVILDMPLVNRLVVKVSLELGMCSTAVSRNELICRASAFVST